MDFSKFKTSDWLIVGGGIAMLIAGFLPWVKASVMGFSDSGNGFEFFWTGTLPWILLIAAAVVTVLLIQGTLKQDTAPWTLILLVGTALALLLLLIRLIFNPLEGKDEIESVGSVSRQIGLYLAVLAGIAAVAGSFLNFQAAGGDLKDLTDVNKLKQSFNKGGDTPPPPPPPPAPGGDTPPPPA